MSRQKNEVIGEVECPTKGCTKKCEVYRFRQRGTGAIRFAGKLYADCPVHGRHGADGRAGTQEYILENATIWGAKEKAPVKDVPAPVLNTPASGQESPSLGKTAAPVQRPVPSQGTPVPAPAPAKVPRWWESLYPIIK